VVNKDAATIVQKISAAQAKVDAAEQHFQSIYRQFQSAGMAKTEFQSQGIPAMKLEASIRDLGPQLDKASRAHFEAGAAAESVIKAIREQLRRVHLDVENLVDYLQTQIKSVPLATDSVNLDVQFFSKSSNSENSITVKSKVIKFMGSTFSAQIPVQVNSK
jgi:hypothetical protein